MLSLRHFNNCLRQNTARLLSSYAPSSSSARPWFVDDDRDTRLQPPPHFSSPAQTSTLPDDIPEHIIALHDALCKSPHLQAGGVQVRPPLPTHPGPVLLETQPKGRRRRGGTNSGIGIPDASSGPWRWLVLAQVRVCASKYTFLLSSSFPSLSSNYHFITITSDMCSQAVNLGERGD